MNKITPIEQIENIIAGCYKKHSYVSDAQAAFTAKQYIKENKDILQNILDSVFKEVKVVPEGIDLILGEHDADWDGEFVAKNGGVTIRFTLDGSIEFRDAVKPYHHAHIRFDYDPRGRRLNLNEINTIPALIACWGSVPNPIRTIREEGFIQALMYMIQFSGKSSRTHGRQEVVQVQF